MAGLVNRDSTRAGSLPYICPEVIINNKTELSPSIDVWSLGCILYELLFGERLFKDLTRPELIVNSIVILGKNKQF